MFAGLAANTYLVYGSSWRLASVLLITALLYSLALHLLVRSAVATLPSTYLMLSILSCSSVLRGGLAKLGEPVAMQTILAYSAASLSAESA